MHRSGTLLGASKVLGVARTTVARRVAALEDELGTRLFHRAQSGFHTTAAGLELIEAAERVEAELVAAEAQLRGRDGALGGRLRVSTVPLVLVAFGDAFQSFAQAHPDIQLEVGMTPDRRAPGEVDADVVTRLSNQPPERLFGTRVGALQFGVYASTQRVDELGSDAPLSAYPWIGRAGGDNVEWFRQWLAANAPGAEVVFEMEYEPIVLQRLVREGIGAQILPCILADNDPGVSRIAPLDPLFRLDLWLLSSEEMRRNRGVRAFYSAHDQVACCGVRGSSVEVQTPRGRGRAGRKRSLMRPGCRSVWAAAPPTCWRRARRPARTGRVAAQSGARRRLAPEDPRSTSPWRRRCTALPAAVGPSSRRDPRRTCASACPWRSGGWRSRRSWTA